MEFITQGNRIAVENFDKGKLYTVLWKNDTQENLMCISIGADCVVFQGEAPINLFTLSMRNADTIDSIEPTQLGTTNYNNLINKPQINGVDLIGNKTGTQLGLASQSDLEDYATNASVVAGLATKQDALSSSQLQAVNSGITSELVTQIGTNTSAIAGKQDALSSSQLAAVNSGITSENVEQITTNKNNISSFHKAANTEIYFSEVMPTGTITDGSYWISTAGVKIYGNTDNLFDGTVVQGSFNPATGEDVESTNRVRTTFMTTPLTAGTYFFSVVGADDTIMYVYDESKQIVSALSIKTWQTLPYTFILSGTYYIRFGFRKNDNADIVPSEVTSITLIKENTWH